MSECTHDCSTCGSDCASRTAPQKDKLNEMSSVKKVIGVISGKGGVGKSLVTSMLAVLSQRNGYNTAVLDADITGPSIGQTFGVHKKVLGNGTGAHAKIHLMQTDLFECPATLNDTWGYKTFDQNWKSAERLREIRARLNERGINYLLNVGPDYLGRIPAPSVDILREMAQQDSEEK